METRYSMTAESVLLTTEETANLLSLTKRYFANFLKSDRAKDFPTPVRFSERVVRYKRHEVEKWVNDHAGDKA